ncbi:MAG TPA: hypothetical protein VMU64_11555 [Acidimicrobiales bacterium]|nr:hypothetical protein [Acidimicrobiales bacterium]
MRLWRCVATAVGAALLLLVACAPLAGAAAPAPKVAAHSTLSGHRSPAPAPSPCLQNAAQCSNAGSLVTTGATLGSALILLGGPVIMPAALLRRLRRWRGAYGFLPSGRSALIMRPPRSLPAFA